MKKTMIQPGYLVGLSVKCRGGVEYKKTPVVTTHEDGREITTWETTRVLDDPTEFHAANKERGRLRAIISGLCIATPVGLLCPKSREDELDKAIQTAQTDAQKWNTAAKFTYISVDCLPGEIAENAERAAKAITSEVRDLLQDMRGAVAKMDKDSIREAADKARSLAQMLSPELEEKVSKAVKNARSIARKIVKRVEKAGEDAASVLAEINTAELDQARFAFLDIAPTDVPQPEYAEMMPATDVQRFDSLFDGLIDEPLIVPVDLDDDAAELDTDDTDAPAVTVPTDEAPEIDLD